MDSPLRRRRDVVLSFGAVAVVLLGTATALLGGWSLRPLLQVAGLQALLLQRDLQGALDKAEGAGRLSGRRELDAWHAKILDRVDKHFLEQHLSFTAKWMATARYLWTSTVAGSDKAFNEQLEAQERSFRQTVASEDELRAELTAMAQKMAAAFADALDAELGDIARQHGMTDAEIDAHLSGIEAPTMVISAPSIADEARRIRWRFSAVKLALNIAQDAIPKAINVLSAPLSLTAIQSAAKEAAGTKGALKVAAHKAALTGAKATGGKTATAAAAKVGGAIAGGPFVLVAIAGVIAWEWWDHRKSVAEQKPILLQQIGEGLAAYETALLDADGQLGSVLVQMKQAVRRAAVQ